MSLITRYLLRQFLGPLLVCLVAFNGIFILFDLFGHLSRFLDANLPLPAILKYYAGVVCTYTHWFLPASCMLATLYTMWQLSHHSELTAMRASGISFHRLTLPFFCVAVLASLLAFANAELLAPGLSAWSDRLKESGFARAAPGPTEKFNYTNPAASRTWRIASIDTSSVEACAHLFVPTNAADRLPAQAVEIKRVVDGRIVWGVAARRADYLDGIWWLSDPEMIHIDPYDGSVLPDPDPERPRVRLPDPLPFPELTETPRDLHIEARQWDYLSASDMLRRLLSSRDDSDEHWFDFWYRLAAPWACLVITLLSIPTGITTGRQSVFKGVVLALATFFAFYLFSITLKYLGQKGYMPPVLAAWLPNAVFLAIGLGLYRRLT